VCEAQIKNFGEDWLGSWIPEQVSGFASISGLLARLKHLDLHDGYPNGYTLGSKCTTATTLTPGTGGNRGTPPSVARAQQHIGFTKSQSMKQPR